MPVFQPTALSVNDSSDSRAVIPRVVACRLDAAEAVTMIIVMLNDNITVFKSKTRVGGVR